MLIYSTSAYYSLSAKIRTKWIIGRTKWIFEYFSYLALVEYRTKWIRIKPGPGVCISNLIESLSDILVPSTMHPEELPDPKVQQIQTHQTTKQNLNLLWFMANMTFLSGLKS